MSEIVWIGPRFTEARHIPSQWGAVRSVAGEHGADTSVEDMTGVRQRWGCDFLDREDLRDLIAAGGEITERTRIAPYLSTASAYECGAEVLAADPRVVSSWRDRWTCRSNLERAGLRVPDSVLVSAAEASDDAGRLVWQTRVSSAGAGTFGSLAEAILACPDERELIASEYIAGPSFNIAGVVYADGTIECWPPSIQLLDLLDQPRSFGHYFGNAWTQLAEDDVAALRDYAQGTGRALFETGFTGAFGVDVVLRDGEAFGIDLNPRLQGSTSLQCALDAAQGHPTLMEHHLRAVSGAPRVAPAPKRYSSGAAMVLVKADRELSAVGEAPSRLARSMGIMDEGAAPSHLRVQEGATICRVVTTQPAVDPQTLRPTPLARQIAALGSASR